jgi:4-diphosphocytidyl-2-C-methyl-D-erythritol kinase
MEKALKNASLVEVSKCIMNDFEEVCIPRLLEIDQIKKKMLLSGALCSQMSGSGSAVFGIFDREDCALSCFESLKRDGLDEVYFLSDSAFEKMYKGE